jgi:hypothetical protein
MRSAVIIDYNGPMLYSLVEAMKRMFMMRGEARAKLKR